MLCAAHEDGVTLVDGRRVALRDVAPGDADAIRRLFDGLSPRSRALRFGAARRGLTAAEAAAMAAAPGPGRGVVAVAGGEWERIVGLARYERAAGAADAELGIAVADAWHGLGVGTALVELLLSRAGEDGVDSVWALVRRDNAAMLRVLRELGCPVWERATPDGLVLRMPAGPAADAPEPAAARFARAAVASLDPLLRPASLAVVGASRDPASPGGAVAAALTDGGFPGAVHLVSRSGGTMAGRPVWPSLAAVPERVELVVAAVPAHEVPGVARQAVAHGARALVVLSSGFADAGPDGAAIEAELLHVARTGGLRLVGPNCLGVASSDPERPLNATFAAAAPSPGRIALATQSGGVAAAAIAYCAAQGVGLSSMVSLGAASDVGAADLLPWWDADPRTSVVLLYLERMGDHRLLAQVARRVTRTTPVLALSPGRGAAARRGAAHHSAAVAADDGATDALLDLAGIVRGDTLEQLLDAGRLLSSQPAPAGDRVAIVSNAAGPAILAADACEAAGLAVPVLPAALREALEEAVPGIASASNPVDLGAGARPDDLRRAGALIAASGAVDALLVAVTPLAGIDADALAAAADRLEGGAVTVVGCRPDAAGRPRGDGVPWLAFPEGAAAALGHAAAAGAAARRTEA
ncbi:MAG: GNAT family N-acetyltransferase [Thermoleophilia bacterium]